MRIYDTLILMDDRRSKIIACKTLIAVLLVMMPGQVAAGNTSQTLLDDLRSNNKEVETAAIVELGKIKDASSLKALIGVFNTIGEDWKIQIKALDALAASGAPMVTDILMYALVNACPAIKWHAAVGLGGFNDDERVVNALIAALDDSTMFIREAAIESLGRIRALKAVPYLGKELRDSHFSVRLQAVRALERIGDQQSLFFLKWSADNETDPIIRNEAAAIVMGAAARQGALLR